MADKPELLYLQNGRRSSLVFSEVHSTLIARARKDAAGLLAHKPQRQCLATVKSNGKWGLIDRSGKFAAKPLYYELLPFSCGRAAFSAAERSRIVYGSVYYDERDHEYDLFGNGCKLSGSNYAAGLCGYLDVDGRIVIRPSFQYARGFSEDLAGVVLYGEWGFIRKDGTFSIKPCFQDVRNFHGGLSVAAVDGKYGMIDKSGQFVIQPRFDYLWEFAEDLACAYIDGKYGFIDRRGAFVGAPRFYSARNFRNGIARVSTDWHSEQDYYIDKAGKPIMDQPEMRAFTDFSEGLGVVGLPTDDRGHAQDKHLYGYVDNCGRFRIQPKFEHAYPFRGGYAPVTVGGKWKLINTRGEVVQIPDFDSVDYFQEGLSQISVNKMYGFIDMRGEIVIEPQFRWASDFRNGLAAVGDEGGAKSGFIDRTGKIVIDCQFDRVRDFQ